MDNRPITTLYTSSLYNRILNFAPILRLLYSRKIIGQEVGRGAIIMNTTELASHAGEMGHPMGYLGRETIAQQRDEDTQRMVGKYEPNEEFVSVLLKPQDRQSSYRVWVMPAAAGEAFK